MIHHLVFWLRVRFWDVSARGVVVCKFGTLGQNGATLTLVKRGYGSQVVQDGSHVKSSVVNEIPHQK